MEKLNSYNNYFGCRVKKNIFGNISIGRENNHVIYSKQYEAEPHRL